MKSPHHFNSAREHIVQALHHLDHILPAQAPILNFVHHNTIHGFQHLPFEEALAQFEKLTGIEGYLPDTQHRKFYEQGRIDDSDLFAALSANANLQSDDVFCELLNRKIYRKELYRLAMLFDFSAISASQFIWQTQELNILKSKSAESLWQHILDKLDLNETELHVEDLFDLTPEQVVNWQNSNSKQYVEELLTKSFAEIGKTFTLRGFIANLTGVDCLDFVRPQLIRLCASALDEGVAAWSVPNRSELGLYGAWRAMLDFDANAFLAELPNAPELLAQLPDDAIDTIIFHLETQHIPQEKWADYLQRLALEIPGWAGMINWREQHSEYTTENDIKPKLADFLAIRLTLDRLYLNQTCRDLWQCDARLDKLQTYFEKNLAEFSVRSEFYTGNLPEYLSQQAQDLLNTPSIKNNFEQLADLISTWQNSPLAKTKESIYNEGWRLFHLCQHLDLNTPQIEALSSELLREMLKLLDDFNAEERNKIWLIAYERHYREQIFHGLRENYQRGRWYKRDKRPSAQLIFCMDEREESFRRHVEELNPNFETFGAAGFFGIAMNYQGFDDAEYTPLCPVVITPVHQVHEVAKTNTENAVTAHHKGHKLQKKFHYLQYQSLRRHLLRSSATILALAPFTLIELLVKTLKLQFANQISDQLHQILVPNVPTELQLTATENHPSLNIGFTDTEQVERVANFLRAIGLTDGFAPIVCFFGHGSTSLNNPHEAAHDCGACGGRQGGANARAFAAMANRAEVRTLLAQRDIIIPDDCWFVGTQHDTCSDGIIWYDQEAILPKFQIQFNEFKTNVLQGRDSAAHERCRRLLSRNHPDSHTAALAHVKQRSADLSQVRPEFGHATNAVAIIGRRAITQGLFLDRRSFLISYDCTEDIEGKILESILLTAGPVGAGINLEYYFSTVNNERFGCSTKIPHNITGLFAVMEGASSDLRTGLPRQMIEIHEAMRLQIIVEAKTSVLEQIYARQPSLSELIGGGWVHLSAKDPDSEAIFVFERGVGFVQWQAEKQALPIYEKSSNYYSNHSEPLPPVLIKQPE
jgi:uncharacterized protein